MVLINANIDAIPVDLYKISESYEINTSIMNGSTRFENAVIISEEILKLFGLNTSFKNMLATRLLSPMIAIREIQVKSAEQLAEVFDIPLKIARQRFERFQILTDRNQFLVSNLEKKVLKLLNPWIQNYLNHAK